MKNNIYEELQDMYLLLRGAFSICEKEGREIADMLREKQHMLIAFDAICTAITGTLPCVEDAHRMQKRL